MVKYNNLLNILIYEIEIRKNCLKFPKFFLKINLKQFNESLS